MQRLIHHNNREFLSSTRRVGAIILASSVLLLGLSCARSEPRVEAVLAELAAIHARLLQDASQPISAERLTVLLAASGDNQQVSAAFAQARKLAPALSAAQTSAARLDSYAAIVALIRPVVVKRPHARVHLFYCPMVRKSWVAEGTQVRNPYAADMRSCGDLVSK